MGSATRSARPLLAHGKPRKGLSASLAICCGGPSQTRTTQGLR